MTAAAVFAHDPARGPGAETLERLLLRRALAFAVGIARGLASGVAGGTTGGVTAGDVRVVVVCGAVDAPGVRRAVGGAAPVIATAADHFPVRVEAVFAGLAVAPGEPCVFVWPRLGRYDDRLASATLEDLRSGCELVIGPVFDGGLYLLGMRGRLGFLAEIDEGAWFSGDVISAAVGAAASAGVDVGLLRSERGLRRPDDVRAALADPLLDEELRSVLGG